MRTGITKETILSNIKIKTIKDFKTREDMKDEWKKRANKWKVKLVYFNKKYVTNFYMGSGLVDEMGKPKKTYKRGYTICYDNG